MLQNGDAASSQTAIFAIYFVTCWSYLANPPKGQNLCKWAPQTPQRNWNPLFYSIFRDLGPIFAQLGPILSNALGPIKKSCLE